MNQKGEWKIPLDFHQRIDYNRHIEDERRTKAMASNSYGDYSSYSLKQNMDAYDKLPKKVRAALMYSDHNWSAGQIRYVMTSKKYRMKSARVIEILAWNDAKMRENYLKNE